LAYRAAHPKKPLPAKISWQATKNNTENRVGVSHLCDTLGCIRQKHIDSNIDWDINTSRKSCEGWSLLVYNGIILQETPCNHNMPCVKICVIFLDDETVKYLQKSLMSESEDQYDD